MPSTSNYFQTLKLQTEAAAAAKKAALDSSLAMATQAKVNKDTGQITYDTDASGAPKLGTVDVAYKEQQRLTKAGAEAGGTLRSGQLARNQLNEESAYRSQVTGLISGTAAEKTAIDTDTATKLAEYQALYGTGGANQASSPVVAPPKNSTTPPPITPAPQAPGAGASTKPVTYSPGAVSQIKKAYPAPKKSTPAPKKASPPKRIGGL